MRVSGRGTDGERENERARTIFSRLKQAMYSASPHPPLFIPHSSMSAHVCNRGDLRGDSVQQAAQKCARPVNAQPLYAKRSSPPTHKGGQVLERLSARRRCSNEGLGWASQAVAVVVVDALCVERVPAAAIVELALVDVPAAVSLAVVVQTLRILGHTAAAVVHQALVDVRAQN